jgi:hypothetical protein
MGDIKFKLALLDEFGYPISRYELNIDGEINEDTVRQAVEKNIPEITILMRAIENEGNSQ